MFNPYYGYGGYAAPMNNMMNGYGDNTYRGIANSGSSGFVDPRAINNTPTTYVNSVGDKFGGYQMGNDQNPNNAQNNNMLIPMLGRPVSGLDEVKAFMVPMDGKEYYFTDFGNGKIYTKSFGLDGRSTVKVFTQDNFVTPSAVASAPTPSEPTPTVSLEEFNKVKSDLESVKRGYNELVEMIRGFVAPPVQAPSEPIQPMSSAQEHKSNKQSK